ncbi:hypothetical protein TMM008_22070 [Pseudomonas sp. 008]|nr:hypothetical protein TMM008_22070 [Pseudomonas sp. 008]
MTTPATITAMAGITTVIITITTTVIRTKLALFRGGEWAGRRCWWPLPLRRRAWCKCARGRPR